MSLTLRVTIYNIINVFSIVFFPIMFFEQFRLFDPDTLSSMDSDLFVIFFWPFLFMVLFIQGNKAAMRWLIHRKTKVQYEANNIELDEVNDSGSLTEEEKKYLPNFLATGGRKRQNLNFDLFAFGNIDDLGIKYKVDKLKFKVEEKDFLSNDYHTIFNYNGSAFIIEYANINFGSAPMVYLNREMENSTAKAEYILPDVRKLKHRDYLLYDKTKNDEFIIEKLSKILNKKMGENRRARIYMLFRNNKIIITTDGEKFKIGVPFILTKGTLERMLSFQKGQIYRFNMLLNKISVAFNEI